MQGNGLINKLYRPIDTTVTSKAPHSTPLTILNITYCGKLMTLVPIILWNKHYSTLCVFTVGNSSLNAQFESLESKLCGKIMEMKSYFIDELRSLKNETTVNKKQVCNINTDETTTLKNKIKLLELENKLLKDDVTNKQKFMDTVLQQNSKLVKTLMLALLALLHTRQRSSQLKGNITRNNIPS